MADAYYDKVSLLLPMSGSNNGTTFTNYSPTPRTITANGNAITSTAQSKYYGSAAYFDGAGDYLSIPSHTDFDFGTGNLTIEAWVRLDNVTGNKAICGRWSVTPEMFAVEIQGSTKLKLSWYDVNSTFNTIEWTTSLSATTWYHIAICRSGSTWYAFVNGSALTASLTNVTSQNIKSGVNNLTAGIFGTTASPFAGYMNDLRISTGLARYTAGFTPPGKLVGTLSGTVKDDANSNAVRSVLAVPRLSSNLRTFGTASASDGTWSITVPDTTYSVICLDDAAGTVYNDLVYGGITPV